MTSPPLTYDMTALRALLARLGVNQFEIRRPANVFRYDIHLPNGMVIGIPYELATREPDLNVIFRELAERLEGALLLDGLAQ